jgi:hypothetical protein
MLEFAFSMVVLFLMMYGIVMVFRWGGLDLVERQQTHESVLVGGGPPDAITPDFYTPTKMETVWGGP